MSMKNSPTADTRCRWVSPRNRWCDRIVASGYEPWLHGGRAEARKISGPARATRIHVPGYQPPVYYNSRSYCKSSRRSRRTWCRTRRGWPWRRRTRRRRRWRRRRWQRPLLHLVRHSACLHNLFVPVPLPLFRLFVLDLFIRGGVIQICRISRTIYSGIRKYNL